MTDYNDYKLKYDLFLAKNELYRSLISTGAVAVLGETSTAILNESLNTRVNDYIDKVMNSAQKSWDNYKKAYANDKDQKYFQSINQKINKANPSFNINNYKTTNMGFLTQVKVLQFNYETMKEDLKNKETFVKKYYPRFIINNKVDIKTGMRNMAFTKTDNIVCNKKLLIQSYNFCVTDFLKYRTSIEADLTTSNRSTTAITNAMNSVSPANESGKIFIDYLNMVSNSILLEAPTNPTNTNQTNRMTFSDSDGNKVDPKDKKKENSNTLFLKAVNVYMEVSMDIISTKMKLLGDIYNNNKAIVTYYIKWADKNKKANEPANKKTKTNVEL